MPMWTKYTYLCTDCDALIEITADCYPHLDPRCICGGVGVTILLTEEEGNAPILTDVSNVTPTTVVKINSNPYN